MKILIVHNQYQLPGGEDAVFNSECSLLEKHGESVIPFTVNNDEIHGIFSKIKTALSTTSSSYGKELIQNQLKIHRPDVVHVHNFFPLLSPSIFDACHEASVPVVYTLHNYRIVCPSGLLMINGEIYEESIHRNAYWAVFKKAYRNSYLGTLILARMIEFHKKSKTWHTKVSQFITLTKFAKSKFVEAGLPADKISIKPNFIFPPSKTTKNTNNSERHGALFVGRLSSEKGVKVLIESWREVDYPLKIAGDGPLLSEAQKGQTNCIHFLGQQNSKNIYDLMSRSSFLILPSECYEMFPIVLLEAYAHGLPVIASKIGSLAELIIDGKTGLHFNTGDSNDLAAKVQWMIDHPDVCKQMGENAKKEFHQKYAPEHNYEQLLSIYNSVVS